MKMIMDTAIFLVWIVCFVSACPFEKEKSPEEGDFYQGDINLSPLNFVNRFGGVASRNLSLRWPNGVVPYYIADTSYTSREVKNIQDAMIHIEDETIIDNRPCITFVPLRKQTDYIRIEKRLGCWSYLGRQGGAQRISLESPGCVGSKGIPVHELLHALGFEHEHSRPDRDQYVTVINDTIIPGKEEAFDLYDINTVDTLGTAYDYESIMHYGNDYFSRNRSLTLVPKKPGVIIGQRDSLSVIDIDEIRKYYGCK